MLGLGLSILPAAGGAGGLPTLDLDFLTGALDPRITFTRASTGTYFGSDGLLKTAAVGEPRFDHDPATLQPRGLLIEWSRTNLLLWSEEFSNAVWTKQGSTITADATSTPLGMADDLIENAETLTHGANQAINVVSGTAYTFSIFAKAKGRSLIRVGASNLNSYAVFDLAAGTVQHTDAGITARIQALGGGVYRCSVTQTATATATYNWLIRTQSSTSEWPGSGAYTGDGVSGVSVIGAQVEVGAFQSSYIPTTTAAVTRAVENAMITGTNFSSWFNASEGTIVAEFRADLVGSSANYGIFGVQTTGYSNGIHLFAGSGVAPVLSVQASSAEQAYISAPTLFTRSAINRIAAAYKADDFARSANGGTVGTDTSGLVPTGLTTAYIGTPSSPLTQLYGHIRRLRYWPTRLSNARLQELTA